MLFSGYSPPPPWASPEMYCTYCTSLEPGGTLESSASVSCGQEEGKSDRLRDLPSPMRQIAPWNLNSFFSPRVSPDGIMHRARVPFASSVFGVFHGLFGLFLPVFKISGGSSFVRRLYTHFGGGETTGLADDSGTPCLPRGIGANGRFRDAKTG